MFGVRCPVRCPVLCPALYPTLYSAPMLISMLVVYRSYFITLGLLGEKLRPRVAVRDFDLRIFGPSALFSLLS
ncbi:hypothetical protein L211DRAFT_839522 [Terfezia boudieri ATCC MYA-4762]|uniref:Uncharacterized protein n=1 Tax=Terfezia boudieri ATCC MYA-4762 TaxID=1051890 RepID=A0A3N4LHX0_9PEZI|nr:hypothetical protein L211DRAFT_839522 [Terfezia boudieri ATCC MYA-4762]